MGIGSAETAPEGVENPGNDGEVGPFQAGPRGAIFGFQCSKLIPIIRDPLQQHSTLR